MAMFVLRAQAATASTTATPSQQAPAHPRMAMGLIVKLKDSAGKKPSVVRLEASSLRSESAQELRTRLFSAAHRHRVSFLISKPTAFAAQVIHSGHPVPYEEAEAQAQRLSADPDVEWVAVNEMAQPASATPYVAQTVVADDTFYADQKWLQRRDNTPNTAGIADIPAAWDKMAGHLVTPVVVAVLDSGILPAPDLDGRILPGYDFISEPDFSHDGDGLDADPTDSGTWVTEDDRQRNPQTFSQCDAHDSSWHGLTVSYMLAAQTGNGYKGAGILAPLQNGVLLPVRVAGSCGAAVSDIIEGMLWAAGINYHGSPPLNPNPARVINVSLGGNGSCQDGSQASLMYQQTIAALKNKGVLVVASAGNGDNTPSAIGYATPTRPASCDGVLAATGLNTRGFKAKYANLVSSTAPRWGIAVASGDSSLSYPDFPIVTLTNHGTQAPDSTYLETSDSAGTSYAAPTAAGVAALMLAVAPNLSVDDLLQGITSQARPFPSGFASDVPLCQAGDASTRGNCTCTTATCGSGILDAGAAVQWAIDRATSTPFAGSSAYAGFFIPDRLITTAVTANNGNSASSGKGGGGSAGWLDLLALTLGAALAVARRRHTPRS